ncbi:GmrSD restriction endonuclease domain-containing protein [Kibdelosporangium philippinense]
MALDSPKLRDLLKNVAVGKIQLPDFQREWKWDDERIKALIATVTLNYPLGVVMTLETGGVAQFRARTLAGVKVDPVVVPDLLLLDGQQRLTSLVQALHLDQPVATVDTRGRKVERWYYMDIDRAVDPNADRDEAVVSVPADRVLREDFARRVRLDLSTREGECGVGYFPLRLVFDDDAVSAWQKSFVGLTDENWDRWAMFNARVLNNVRECLVPMIRLDSTTPNEAVCSVFERVNTGGVVLNVFELLTATYAGDRKHSEEHGTEYSLPEVWRSTKEKLVGLYPVLGQVESGRDEGLTNVDFLQAVSLVLSYERKTGGSATAVACKRRDLLALPLVEFRRLEPVLAEAFAWVGRFLSTQSIFTVRDLPYRTQLVPLAAVKALLGNRADDPEVMERLDRWFWCGVLGEMYGGSVESRFTRDVEQLVAWINGSPDEPDTVVESVFLAERLTTLTTRNSAAYKGIQALIVKQGAVDWSHPEDRMTGAFVIGQGVAIRQIFPATWITRNGHPKSRADSIVNKTPMSHAASRRMTGAPSAYVNVLARESGTPDEWFDDILTTHLVDPVSLRADDFTTFYASRYERLLSLVEMAMNKRVVRRTGAAS